ncbi:MAG: nucleoid-associated protein, partial [Bacteroidetes bacterium]|nr:nucleoid-associated protein [Bacteroidota bacterium]
LAEHLYDRSVHHAIKGGEFYIVYIRDCVIDGEYVDALGLFKSENKETYLKVMHSKQEVSISYDKGVNINKLDKGCLILNTEKERGYKVCIVDNSSGNRDTAGYWKDEFLGLEARTDSFYRTRQYLDLCKEFVKDVYNNENDVNRIEQAGLLDRTVGYFRENEFFRENDFEQTVIREPEVIDAFRDYKQQYMEESNVQGMGEFDISEGAVKSAQKYFKSVLKLDRNFHVYIHGNHRMIERGYDEGMGKKYYKLYYDQER